MKSESVICELICHPENAREIVFDDSIVTRVQKERKNQTVMKPNTARNPEAIAIINKIDKKNAHFKESVA